MASERQQIIDEARTAKAGEITEIELPFGTLIIDLENEFDMEVRLWLNGDESAYPARVWKYSR